MSLTVHLKALAHFLCLLFVREFREKFHFFVIRKRIGTFKLFVNQLPLHGIVVSESGRGVVAAPLPRHVALAVVLQTIEVARRTVLLRHDGAGLQAVGEDDVGVHGSYIQMQDLWILLALRRVSQHLQRRYDLLLDLIIVFDFRSLDSIFHFQSKCEIAIHMVNQHLQGRGNQREFVQNIGSEDTRL